MGCQSYLCVFDYRRYLDHVVPAMRRLYETDEVEPWLAAAWPRRELIPVPRFTDSLRVMMGPVMAAPDLLGRGGRFVEGEFHNWEALADLSGTRWRPPACGSGSIWATRSAPRPSSTATTCGGGIYPTTPT